MEMELLGTRFARAVFHLVQPKGYALAEMMCNNFPTSLHFHWIFTLFYAIYSAFSSSLCHHLPGVRNLSSITAHYYSNLS